MIADLLKIDTKLQYCCIKARLPTRKIKIHSGNLRGKLKVESSSAMLSFVYFFFKRKIWGSSFSSLQKNYLEMIPWKEPLTDYRLVLRWPLCCYFTCHESTGHLDLEHRVWNEKIDLFLKTRLTWELKVYLCYEEILTDVFSVELTMDDSLTVDDVKVKLVFASSDI